MEHRVETELNGSPTCIFAVHDFQAFDFFKCPQGKHLPEHGKAISRMFSLSMERGSSFTE